MRSLKALMLALIVAVFSFGLVACGDDEDDGGGGGSEGESLDLVIGNLVPQTGALSAFAPAGEKAIGLAVDEVNAAIEEVGSDHSITSLTEDTQTDPQAGVQAARKLAGEDATCFNGAFASSVTIPVAQSVSSREGILQISPVLPSPDITGLEEDDFLFRSAIPDTGQGPLLSNVIADAIGGVRGQGREHRAPVTTPTAKASLRTFSEAWEAKGRHDRGRPCSTTPSSRATTRRPNQIVAGNPDTILIIDFPETFTNVGPALLRTGEYDPANAWGTDGLTIPEPAEAVAG